MSIQQDLPPIYAQLSAEQLVTRIAARKSELGADLCILGHHYQRDEIIQFADFIGDSLKLSRQAASQQRARFIVFCGVHFMAESADILSAPQQAVLLPNMRAGCAMAAMAEEPAVAEAMEELSAAVAQAFQPVDSHSLERLCHQARIVPITYVNSTAAIKALTGRCGGACCTSSNVRSVFEWALRPAAQGGAGADKILAIPDQHLAANTAAALGFGPDACAVYDPLKPSGGLDTAAVRRATFILWKGACYVHQLFRAQHIKDVRAAHPGIRVIVHPECRREVVELADEAGSTERIIKAVTAAPGGSAWAIGTESNLVNRMAQRRQDCFIRTLAPAAAMCVQMAQIDLPHLLWILDGLAQGELRNRVTVDPAIAADARVALQRMITIT
ncbi:MAG: quinolinate synthase NadA [Planctomycetaceae bacterium]|nr:quinolinate synthase NadA [Planctomycetaceae bacterium]